MSARITALALLLVCTAGAGCLLITGSTNGYTQAGSEAGTSCEASSECDEGGEICCLSSVTLSGACQKGACAEKAAQLCGDNKECGDAACVLQSCSLDGSTPVELRACGLVLPPLCTKEN
jgi:hypothetical protein